MKTIIEIFDSHFRRFHERSCELVALIPDEKLFWQPVGRELSSCGEYLLRSAAAVEQTFGGITARLWDDPFEWTLPEELSTRPKIVEYLEEVEVTRIRGFGFFESDADLLREIPAPERLKPILQVLLETVTRAEHLQGRAFAVFQMFSPATLPQI